MPLSRTVLEVAPTGLAAQVVSATQINLSWSVNPRAGSYRLYRGSTLIYSAPTPSFGDTGLTASTLYSYQVSCVGANGQEGPKSSVVSGTTLPVSVDVTPNQFTFSDQSGVTTGSTVTSAAVTISGLSASTSITLAAVGGTINKNGGSFASSQSVQNGDTVQARVTASSSGGTAVDCVVTAVVSGVTDTFTATTAGSASPGSSEAVFPTDFKFTSTRTTTEVFAFGHPFAHGDVPSGYYVTSDLATFQCTVLNRWPDGSVKFAVIAGRKAVSGSIQTTITLDKTLTAPSGTALNEGNLSALSPLVSVQIGSIGTVTLASLLGLTSTGAKGSNGLVRTFVSGPQMSEFHYRSDVGSSQHLAVWFYVRLWANNQIEVEVLVENNYAKVASQVDVSYTAVITINGTQRFNAAVSHYRRTRWRTIHWYDGTSGTTDYQRVIPQHNSSYIKATGLFPNYGGNAVDSSVRAAWGSTLTPMSAGNNTVGNLGQGGPHPHIGLLPTWDADYVNTGNSSAYRALMYNGSAWDSWPCQIRDENTGRPIAFSNYANTVFSPQASTTGDVLNNSGSANPLTIDDGTVTHMPAAGYAAYVVTGRPSFLDSMASWGGLGYLIIQDSRRGGSQGKLSPVDLEARGLAWALRQRSMVASVWPDSMAAADNLVRTDYIASLQYIVADWEASYLNNNLGVFSTFQTAGAYNGLDILSPGSDFAATDVGWAMWQQDFLTATVGFLYDQDLAINASAKASLIACRDFFYKSIVGRCGDAEGFNYRYAGNYAFSLGTLSGSTPTFFTSWAQVYARALALNHVTTTTAEIGDALLSVGAIWASAGSTLNNPEGPWAELLPALAYAVKHGAEDAVLANKRIKSASNYATLYGGSSGAGGYGSAGGWFVDPPGAPSWFTALTTGQWGTIASSGTVNAVLPSPLPDSVLGGEASSSILNSWSGMGVDPDRRELILCANGGHADYPGNEVYAVSLGTKTPAWRRLADPTPNAQLPADAGGGTFTEGDGLYQDGRPRAMHNTFEVFAKRRMWMPTQNSVTSGPGGMYNRCVSWNRDDAALLAADDRRVFGGGGTPLAWTGSNIGPWALHGSTSGVNGTTEKFGTSVYNPRDGYVYALGGSGANSCPYWRIGTGAKGTTLGSNSGRQTLSLSIGQFSGWAVCIPNIGTKGVLVVGDVLSSLICVLDCSKFGQSDAWATVSPGNITGTGWFVAPDDTTYYLGGSGGVYHASSRQILVGEPRSIGARIYKLQTPSATTVAGLLAGSWTWTNSVPAGATPTPESTSQVASAYGRWNLIPEMGDGRAALVFAGRTTGPVYVLPIASAGL